MQVSFELDSSTVKKRLAVYEQQANDPEKPTRYYVRLDITIAGLVLHGHRTFDSWEEAMTFARDLKHNLHGWMDIIA